ncbi:hypothetical protein [Alloactinosynnema sp. L-07]|uniref:hypothetical protein n=1 Tax=Alloactinosynnema sp. L-07 TaxID=1653480 RepID=UPI00065F0294|nr:hypothetical protein [Alloactinosynnema sp. L-07]CRK59883.1 hypothetical protein [Alloactinosynnema sp. L-07]
MTAEAHRYDDIHELVDQLNPVQADAVRAVVLQLVTGSGSSFAPDRQVRRLSFAGSVTAEPDFAERSEDILREINRRSAG